MHTPNTNDPKVRAEIEAILAAVEANAEAESRSHTEEMEWTCSHGVGHPTQKGIAAGYGVHGCDRCCLEVEQ